MHKALLGMMLCVSACSSHNDPNICTSPAPLWAPRTRADVAQNCVHRWSYRLARAPGPNPEIAVATLGACDEAFDYWAEDRRRRENLPNERLPEIKQAIRQQMQQLALYRVVQARAGNCDVP